MQKINSELLLQVMDMMDPIAIFDAEGFYVYVNKAWRDSSDNRMPIEELSKYHSWDLIPDTRLQLVIKNKQPLTGELLTVEGVRTLTNYQPILNKEKELVGVLMWAPMKGNELAKKAAQLAEVLQQELNEANSNIDNIQKENSLKSIIVGESELMNNLRKNILNAARTSSSVIIEGETGTGKEMIARAIHRLGKRKDEIFVPVNCSSIPLPQLDAEFFGYDKAAFAGSNSNGQTGKIELADGGTLFLDEINQLDSYMQPKLYRAIQDQKIQRLGSTKDIQLDFRCIAASSETLEDLIEDDLFGQDLYYALNVVHIDVPALRDHKEDIPELANMFIAQLNSRLETHIIGTNESTIQMLMDYDWPGNIRELQNAIEAAMNRAWDGILETKHFRLGTNRKVINLGDTGFNDNKERFEKELILKTFQECGWNKTKVAAKLGISRSVLYSKIKKYDIH